MFSDERGLWRQIRRVVSCAACALVVPTLSACAPVVGGGVLVGVVAIGALTSRCYDYLDVTVFDAQGRKTCAATVSANNGSDHFELGSCYYAPLTDGIWTLRANLPGYPDAVSSVPVEHTHDCTRHVASVELTISAPHAAPPLPVAPPPAPAPVVPSVLPESPTPPSPAPTPSPEESAAPASPGQAPPVGAFPDQR